MKQVLRLIACKRGLNKELAGSWTSAGCKRLDSVVPNTDGTNSGMVRAVYGDLTMGMSPFGAAPLSGRTSSRKGVGGNGWQVALQVLVCENGSEEVAS